MIPFHRLLIGTAICFCIGFAAWSFLGFRSTASDADLALAILFLCAAGLLGFYLKNLDRFLRR
jgi:heme A synthase